MTRFLLDTHAIVHWQKSVRRRCRRRFAGDLDVASRSGRVLVSTAAFWEIALLARKGRIEIDDVPSWKNEFLAATGVKQAHASGR